jgi:polysaccharide biosynthesis protein PslG
MRRLVAGLVAAAAVAVPASASAYVVQPVHGVNIQIVGASTPSSEIAAQLDDAKALGANTVRVPLIWGDLEPVQGQFDPATIAKVDELMNGAAARGLKILPSIYGTPCWASSAPDSIRNGCVNPQPDTFRYPPSDPNTFAAFAGRFAARYADKMSAFEVWNEPDHDSQEYFKGPDLPGHYAALLKATYPAIKAVAPKLPVLGGSLVGANGNFLKALYADGIKGSYDGLAVHYYGLVLSSLYAIHNVQLKYHDKTPVWLTEFGWTDCEHADANHQEGGHVCVSSNLQAGNLLDIYRGLRKTNWVQGTAVYELRDNTGRDFGLETETGQRKQSFGAVQKAFAGKQGSARKPTLKIKGKRAVGVAPAGDTVTVSIFKPGSGTPTSYATIVPDRNQNYSAKLPNGKWLVQTVSTFVGTVAEKTASV